MSESKPEQKAEQWMATFGERLSVLINVESTEEAMLTASQTLITMVAEVVAWRAQAEPLLQSRHNGGYRELPMGDGGTLYVCRDCQATYRQVSAIVHQPDCELGQIAALLGEGGQ